MVRGSHAAPWHHPRDSPRIVGLVAGNAVVSLWGALNGTVAA